MSSTKTSMPPTTTAPSFAAPPPAADAPQPSALDCGQVFRERNFGDVGNQPGPALFEGLDPQVPNPFGLPTASRAGAAQTQLARRQALRDADDVSGKLSRALVILAAILAMLLLADLAHAQDGAVPVALQPTREATMTSACDPGPDGAPAMHEPVAALPREESAARED